MKRNFSKLLSSTETKLSEFKHAEQVGYLKVKNKKSTHAYFTWCQNNNRPFVIVEEKSKFSIISGDSISMNLEDMPAYYPQIIEGETSNEEAEEKAALVFQILSSGVELSTSDLDENIHKFSKTEFKQRNFDTSTKYKNYVFPQTTTREALAKSRVGQGLFRALLIKYWQGCSVTGCKQTELLKASHIKPWRDSSNQERLNAFNGLLLLPNIDTCFDLGLISFDSEGKILISNRLKKSTLAQLGVDKNMKLIKIEESHQEFLKYHREKVFRS